ncbi:glucosamine--fructose-6-phosphate aminotransferase (isomerizing) [Arthrobacter sp. V4I6]|uniref:SIS domain-containing protein n=1 Tax=unclassified Arthrobacter TaxID=235627 RepID=UPI00278A155F|nr:MULTISPECIES: SIS domain-containing protein [unclassified Arthrobacter]MDQ0822428.1 glucosamine--fructose-6-phosphate aminotransferase (isomerizing) [Arthrobacter sp. V1I7]MDQ0852054.1 glucosamine--fructose-6-phosphate aminotransferase (isomerizing) [Arthrobacter sp. V4I6]
MTTTTRPWLKFDEGIAAQSAGLTESVRQVREWLATGAAEPMKGKSLLFAGIGASYAAAATPVYFLRQAGIAAFRSACADVPDEGTSLADIYVGISQGGRSRETIQALLTVPRERRMAVVNNSDSPLASEAGMVLGVGDLLDSRMSSIGFTATVAALGLVAEWITTGTTDAGWDNIGPLTDKVMADNDEVLRLFAAEIADRGTVDVVAAAPNLTSAEQGALLFREGPFVPSMAMDTRSYLHGPMDCAGPQTAHVLIGRAREGLLADQLSEKMVPILLITDEDVAASATIIRIPQLSAVQRAVLEVALMQRLVQHTADAFGRNIEDRAFTRYDTKVDSVRQVIDGTL